MGEPNSTAIDQIQKLTLGALDPVGGVSGKELRATGLHRHVLQRYFSAFQPEVKNLVGWKSLSEFGYMPGWYNHTTADEKRGQSLTQAWLKKLETEKLSDEKAVLIYDGERLPAPARDYRLFILRDGRLLHYAGGFHAGRYYRSGDVTCGDVLAVLNVLDEHEPPTFSSSPNTEPFIVVMTALSEALSSAIEDREQKVEIQKALKANLQRVIKQVSNK